MTTGRPGAAHIGLPYDVLKQPVDAGGDLGAGRARPRIRPGAPAPTRLRIAAAADAIARRARRPVFICGGGVVAAGAMRRARRGRHAADAPVCTTVSGKGSIADTHPLSVGVVGLNGGVVATRDGGAAGRPRRLRRLPRRLDDHRAVARSRARDVPIVHIDVDPMAGLGQLPDGARAHRRRAAGARGAAATRCDAPGRAGAPRPIDGGAIGARGATGQGRSVRRGSPPTRRRPIRPERVVAELNAVLPRDAVVVADPGTPCPYLSGLLRAAARRAATSSPTARTARSATRCRRPWARGSAGPRRKCVAVMGDGSFGFAVGELETVVRCKVPLLMLVFSNATYGWIKASQKASYGGRYFSVDFSRTDHARVAERLRREGVARGGSGRARCGAARGRSSTTARRWSTSSCSRWRTPRRRSCSGWAEPSPPPSYGR